METTTQEVAKLLVKTMRVSRLAGVMGVLMTVEENSTVTDAEWQLAQSIFDELFILSPEATEMVQNGDEE